MANSCKYYKQQRQVSYDNGVTWIDLQEFRKGALYEPNSSDCTNPSIKIYRWQKADSSDYVCVGDDKHYKEYYQESSDNGQTWSNVVPTTTRASSQVIEYDSSACRSKQYLTFVAQEVGTFSFSGTSANTVQYSLDSGATWTTLENGASTPTLNIGDTVMWKGTMTPYNVEDWEHMPPISLHGIGNFSSSGRFEAMYNVMSLLYGDDFENQTDLSGKVSAFSNLFGNCSGLTRAENLVLPATTLAEGCYSSMFGGCTSLTTVPQLPATTLAEACYSYMFGGCTSLTTVPSDLLLATTLAEACYSVMFGACESLTTVPSDLLPALTASPSCYYHMFGGCTSLTTVPQLPATTLAEACYDGMFLSCTSLTTVPNDLLPATTASPRCYALMFEGCSGLTNAPELPATTLADACYFYMFDGCKALTTVPSILPATTLSRQCYESMFYGCWSLTTAPELPAPSLQTSSVDRCYAAMFMGCRNLNYIKCLATTYINTDGSTDGWVSGVASSGTFVKASSATWPSGSSGIPNNWTIQNA